MTIRVRTDAIRTLRQERGWTQEDLAEAASLHPRTVQRMESEGVVSLRTLNATAKAFEVATHALEFRTDRIDFSPVIMEMKILMLAITRRLMPLDDRDLPNSLIALFAVLSFSASFTLINAIVMVSSQPAVGSFQSIAIIALALLFCGFYAAIVYPLFKLRAWARASMLAICGCFFMINASLLAVEVILQDAPTRLGAVGEYAFNIVVTLWIFRVLMRPDVARLYGELESTVIER